MGVAAETSVHNNRKGKWAVTCEREGELERERERGGLAVGQLELDIFFLGPLDEKKPHQRAAEREETQNLGGNIWKIGILEAHFYFYGKRR